jgi:hypothetical protein
MPAGRTHNARATALALALGVNGLLLLLLLSSHGAAPPLQQAVTAMLWIDPMEPPDRPPPKPPVDPPRPRTPAPVPNPAVVPPPDPVQAVPAGESPGTAIDVPRIDWHALAAKTAEDLVRNEELKKQGHSLNAQPRVMDLPDRAMEKGHVEHFEGGVTLTFDKDCVVTRNPQAMQPWALDRVGRFFGVRPTAGGGCRPNPSRKRAEALEKATKPAYLGGTRPLPEEDGSSIKIP